MKCVLIELILALLLYLWRQPKFPRGMHSRYTTQMSVRFVVAPGSRRRVISPLPSRGHAGRYPWLVGTVLSEPSLEPPER